VNRKRFGAVLVVVGLLLAAAVGVAVYLQTEEATEIARRTPTVEVVVALADLPERVAIPSSSVVVTKVPADMVPPEKAVGAESVVGKYPLTKVFKGEILIRPKLADNAAQTTPAFALKDGLVAFTYAGNDLMTPTGAIRPGDRVDVLLTLPLVRTPAPGSNQNQPQPTITQVTQTLVQNVEVLRVGSFPSGGTQPESAGGGKGITFQVSHQDALILKWAKDSSGTIDLALRHPADKEEATTEAITANYVVRKFKFALAEPLQAQ